MNGKTVLKRVLALVLAALVLLPLVPVWAENELPSELPSEVASYMKGKGDVLKIAYNDYGKDSCWFVLAKVKNENTLYQFKQKNGTWAHEMHTNKAVPQGKNAVNIYVACNVYDDISGKMYNSPVLIIDQLDKESEYPAISTLYVLNNGIWKLRSLYSYTGYEKMVFSDDRIAYYGDVESYNIKGTAYGTVQRDLRYVSLSAIPKTLKEAKKKLTEAPTLPYSEELKAEKIQFTGGQKYPVYSAPSESSLRGGKGKAVVSTNGWIQVFGEEDGFLLIQYSIDADHYRFGYISAKALPKKAQVASLAFDDRAAFVKGVTELTDDPLFSNAALLTLPAGAPVAWLGTLGDFAYVETASGDWARGFVPVSSLSTTREFDMENNPRDDGKPVYEGTISVDQTLLSADLLLTANIAAAPEGPLGNAAVGAVRIYDTRTEQLLCTLEKDDAGCFSGSFVLDSTITSLRLIAVDAADAELKENEVRLEW